MSTAISTFSEKYSAIILDQSNQAKADQEGNMLSLSLGKETSILTPETKNWKHDNFTILHERSDTKNLLKEKNNSSLFFDNYSEAIICGNSLLSNNFSAAAMSDSGLLSQVNGNEDIFFLKNPKRQKIASARSRPALFAIRPRHSWYDTDDDTQKNDDNVSNKSTSTPINQSPPRQRFEQHECTNKTSQDQDDGHTVPRFLPRDGKVNLRELNNNKVLRAAYNCDSTKEEEEKESEEDTDDIFLVNPKALENQHYHSSHVEGSEQYLLRPRSLLFSSSMASFPPPF